jgi:hypothetical protein
MALNAALVKALKRPIHTTWQAIGPDAIEMCEDNEQAMEMCLDADRLLTYGDDEAAHKVYKLEVAQSGYMPLLKYLSANIQLL